MSREYPARKPRRCDACHAHLARAATLKHACYFGKWKDLLPPKSDEGYPGARRLLSTRVGWSVRKRGDGATAFDDGVGEVSGEWVRNRQPAEPGVLVHIMVDSVAKTLELVLANGGQVVNPIGVDPGEITAHFRDPMGNVWALSETGVTHHPAL